MKIQTLIGEGTMPARRPDVTTIHKFSYTVGDTSYPVTSTQSRRTEGLFACVYDISVHNTVEDVDSWLETTCNAILNDFHEQKRSNRYNLSVYIKLLPPNGPNAELLEKLYTAFRHRPELAMPNWFFRLFTNMNKIAMQFSPTNRGNPRGHEGPVM